jgi:hypothetical protein
MKECLLGTSEGLWNVASTSIWYKLCSFFFFCCSFSLQLYVDVAFWKQHDDFVPVASEGCCAAAKWTCCFKVSARNTITCWTICFYFPFMRILRKFSLLFFLSLLRIQITKLPDKLENVSQLAHISLLCVCVCVFLRICCVILLVKACWVAILKASSPLGP